jgi:AcrR family transcriptional regulator
MSIPDVAGTEPAGRVSAHTRAALLDAALELLIEGSSPTMRSVAARAGVGERTIYRYFENREVLGQAIMDEMTPKLSVPLCESVAELEQYVIALFETFERNRALTVATVNSPWSQRYLSISRTTNLRALVALLASGFPKASADDVKAAAAAIRTIVSGAGWAYQRESCELPGEVVTQNAVWLVHVVLERLQHTSNTSHHLPGHSFAGGRNPARQR